MVADRDRKKNSVKMIGDIVHGYVSQLADNIRINSSGGAVLIDIIGSDWLHYKSTWQIMGIIAGSLPEVIDRNGNPAPMTINGIPIYITDVKVLSALNKLSNYPPDVITEALHEIHEVVEMIIEDDCQFKMNEPLGVLHQLQGFHMKAQNKLYINKSRIKESLHYGLKRHFSTFPTFPDG